MEIKDEVLDELLKGYKNPEDLMGDNGIIDQLTKRLLERAMHGVYSDGIDLTAALYGKK